MTERLRPEDPRQIGPHRITARLGSGGMGDVFLGRSPGQRQVAIKVVHKHLAADEEFVLRFAREVRAARAVGGFYTAAVVDADWNSPRPWLATEYIAAPSLKQVVAEHGPLSVAATELLAAGVAEALGAIHAAGVVHRDLTPANILVADSGPRVIDFGIARAVTQSHSLTATGSVIGSPGYMSPEHILGAEVGPAGDVFSLGAVLAFASTGVPPYGHGPIGVVLHRVLHERPDLSAIPEGRLLRVITACLAHAPADRPGTEQVLAAFGRAPGVTLPWDGWLPADVTAAPARAGRRTVLAAGLAGACLLAAGGAAAVAFGRGSRETPGTPVGPPAGTVRWTADVGAVGDREATPPAVAGGSVFAGSIDGHVYALDTATGAVRWKSSMDYEIYRVPVVIGDVVAASAVTKGVDAFDVASGQRLWRADTDVAVLYAGGDPATVFTAPPIGGGIVAYDARTGVRRWSSVEGRRVGYTAWMSLARGVVICDLDPALCALDVVTGAVRWQAEVGSPARSACTGNEVLVVGPTGEGVRALAADSGATLWTFAHEDGEFLAVDGDAVYVTSAMSKLYRLDLRTGALRWMARTDAEPTGAPTVHDGIVYLACGNRVSALDAASGEPRWTAEVGKVRSAVTVADKSAYVVADERVHAITV
ncbi:PQQ-binding-like beta-propeller repeat protein [Nocardia asteroides]|uniref:outer membrane protein assembly factor BamB family protein n=1 Tax=Nocardia asteroides TaxID=1824 RepID=UPI001E5C3A98|nr:PQQ-binding-like beta-propeller repeat protein [Nocardia asteroides]UGT61802.1 PQQ-binding-like beta-propeller repeat protein [Nocardia asteroides]